VHRGVNDPNSWDPSLEELGVSGSVCDLRLSDGGRIVSIVGERGLGRLGLIERGDKQSVKIGERTRFESERIDE
jgi:hypothetical protein